MNIFQHLVQDGENLLKWAEGKAPEVISAFAKAGKLSTALIAWSKCPETQTIETVIEGVIPQSSPYFAGVLTVANELAIELPKLSSIKAIEAVGERLGAEILAILDGHSKPNGISGYIAEFQSLFTA